MQTDPELKPATSNKWISYVIEGVILVLALALGLTIRLAVLETAIVISRSMQPSLEVDDRLLIDHRSSLHGKWRRGDILLFQPPESWGESHESLTKRLIGLPGETVQLVGDRVYIDGRELPEPYVHFPQPQSGESLKLGENEYFVMGDNRANSQDSRELGPIEEENIRGRAIYRLMPFDRISRMPLPQYPF